jgi:hypothetical protein
MSWMPHPSASTARTTERPCGVRVTEYVTECDTVRLNDAIVTTTAMPQEFVTGRQAIHRPVPEPQLAAPTCNNVVAGMRRCSVDQHTDLAGRGTSDQRVSSDNRGEIRLHGDMGVSMYALQMIR